MIICSYGSHFNRADGIEVVTIAAEATEPDAIGSEALEVDAMGVVAIEHDAMGATETAVTEVDTMGAEALLYLGSPNIFSVIEGRSFSRPLSNLTSHLLSPLASM
jgi:hypothetical protein